VLYDTPAGDLRNRGIVLRVRQVGAKALLTYKGPATTGKHKTREEIEVRFSTAIELPQILERIGYVPVFCYEKYRTEYQGSDRVGIATLDETPVGVFLELEGPPDWIDHAASDLGFSESDYITISYASLYANDCAARGAAPGNMVFPKTAPKR
jgi:adenylate cyclase class 2